MPGEAETDQGLGFQTIGSYLERETGLEPATLALARRCSTTELLPQYVLKEYIGPFAAGSTHGVLSPTPDVAFGHRQVVF
jgi:hypothetical protein